MKKIFFIVLITSLVLIVGVVSAMNSTEPGELTFTIPTPAPGPVYQNTTNTTGLFNEGLPPWFNVENTQNTTTLLGGQFYTVKRIINGTILSFHISAYRAYALHSVDIYDYEWGRTFTINADPGTTFLFVDVFLYKDYVDNYSPSLYRPDPDQFQLWYDGLPNQNSTEISPTVRISSFENYSNYLGDSQPMDPYPYYYDDEPVDGSGLAIPALYDYGWIPTGRSSGIDGYFLYEVPDKLYGQDVRFACNLWDFGNVQWEILPVTEVLN